MNDPGQCRYVIPISGDSESPDAVFNVIQSQINTDFCIAALYSFEKFVVYNPAAEYGILNPESRVPIKTPGFLPGEDLRLNIVIFMEAVQGLLQVMMPESGIAKSNRKVNMI